MEESFRFEAEVPVRYRDLDTLGHVNNGVFATYLEQARIEYLDRVLEAPFDDRDGRIVLVNLELDFRRPVRIEDGPVRVACGVVDLGRSSFRMRYRVVAGDAHDDPAVVGETVQVVWDGEASTPVPEAWRRQFRSFEPALEADP